MARPAAPARVRITPGISTGKAHGYYDTLRAMPQSVKAYSLRDNAELARYAATWPDKVTRDFAYLWPNDPDPRKQDAAKMVIPSDGSGGGSGGPYPVNPRNRNSIYQLRVPMPAMEPGHSYLVVWDAWYGNEFRDHISGLDSHKAYQLDGPDRPGGPAKIWWEPNFGYQGNSKYPVADQQLAHYRARHYAITVRQASSGAWLGVPVGPNVSTGSTSSTPCQPHTPFYVMPERWTRTWIVIEYAMDTLTIKDYNGGTLPAEWPQDWKGTLMSTWVADEDRAAVRMYNKAQVTLWNPGCREFWIEFNTSLNEVKPGRPNLVAYLRNINILKDVSAAALPSLLQQPVR